MTDSRFTSALYPTETRTMVLLVDDQPFVGETVRRLLVQEHDIDLHYCSRALNAIEDANQVRPMVILQDLSMPDMDGMELVRRYRENPATHDTPVIVLSAEDDVQIKSDAFARGANDYLVKLPDRVELIARIRYHSRAYLNRLQRDEAYRALRESQQQLLEKNTQLLTLNRDLEEANRTISELARLDALTGLANRRVLDEELKREVLRCHRRNFELTVVMMDIDHFKRVNDTLGHPAGDAVLRAVGQMLAQAGRNYDLAGRYGGEEFLFLLPETDSTQGVAFARRLCSLVPGRHHRQLRRGLAPTR